jgi:hypothetical protein
VASRRLPIHREMIGTQDLRYLPRIAPESARTLDQPSAANPPASRASAPWWPGQSGGRSQNGVDRPVADRGVSDVIWPTGRVAGGGDVVRRTHTPNLTPGQALADDEIITMIGGNTPAKFKLSAQDLKPLEGVTEPGKSASIAIDLTPETEVAQAFGRPAAKQDIVLGAQVKDIRAAGYDVVYAPTTMNPMHVRIIARGSQFTEEGSVELFQGFERLAKKRK